MFVSGRQGNVRIYLNHVVMGGPSARMLIKWSRMNHISVYKVCRCCLDFNSTRYKTTFSESLRDKRFHFYLFFYLFSYYHLITSFPLLNILTLWNTLRLRVEKLLLRCCTYVRSYVRTFVRTYVRTYVRSYVCADAARWTENKHVTEKRHFWQTRARRQKCCGRKIFRQWFKFLRFSNYW